MNPEVMILKHIHNLNLKVRLSSWRKQVEIFMLRRCWKSRLIKSTGSCFMCPRSASPNIQFMNNSLLPWISQKFLRVAPTKKTEALLEALEKDVSKGNKVLKSPNANMSLPNNYFQVVIFSNKSSTAYFVQMFLKENNIDCVGFSQREHYIQRRKNLDQFLTGEVNTAFCCCTILTYEISGEGYLINRLDVQRPWHTWCGYYQPSPISTKCISGVSIITKNIHS